MIKSMFQRVKNLPLKDKNILTILTVIYFIMISLGVIEKTNLISNNLYILLDSAVMFIFYTTTYIIIFSGELGKKLSETNNFTKHFNKNINDLYFITNYFYIGCFISFLITILIVLCSWVNIIIIMYLFFISIFFLYRVFNITVNIIANPRFIKK